MKPSIIILALGLATAIGSGGFFGFSLLTDGSEELSGGSIITPNRQKVKSTVLATGAIRPRVGAEVRVGSQMSGIVEQLNVTVGSRIEEGDIIAVIDSRALQARLNQSLAQVKVLEQEVASVTAQLYRAQKLDTRGIVAKSDVEDLTLERAEAEARLEKAERDADVVKADLAYAEIRAPISGTIASVSTQEGETVAASFATPTFVTIVNNDALELIALVDETDIGDVGPGNPVRFTVESYPTTEFEGTVTQIAPTGTIISGVVNFEVMIDVTPPFTQLRPDMTANVSIETAERDALVIPNGAIQRDGFDRFVQIRRDGELIKRSVKLGTRTALGTEIRQGISERDEILLPAAAGDNSTGS